MTKDTLLGGSTALAGLMILLILIPLGVDMEEVEASTPVLVRPDFWPRVVASLMIPVGLLYVMLNWRNSHTEDNPASEGFSENISRMISETDKRRLLAAIVVGLLFLTVNEATGLVLPAVMIFIISAIGFGAVSWPGMLAGAIGMPLALYLFFEKIAGIPIPLGILEGVLN